MRPIQMVDTQTQYQKIKSKIDLAIQQVLDSSAYINGKIVQEFSLNLAKYLNVKHVIPCANGTDALQIAMMALDLQPGNEIITPSFTYIATTEVIALLITGKAKDIIMIWLAVTAGLTVYRQPYSMKN